MSNRHSSLNVDAKGVLAFLDAIEARTGVEPHALVIRRHGEVVAAGGWAPYAADRPGLVYSLSKTFTATAVGLAAQEGLLTVDDAVHTFFPEFAVADERVRRLTVQHLLTMATGHTRDTWDEVEATGLDPVEAFLALPPDEEPGSVFEYNQPATYTLARIVERTSGASLADYLRPRLFEPLGITEWGWLRDEFGREFGFTGLFVSTDAVARLGQLYLDRGVWDGRQVLDPGWVDAATRAQIATAARPNPDWRRGYGYQLWMSRHGYRGDGAFGQFCIVLPEQDAVVAITSATLGMQDVLDDVWTQLVPALADGVAEPGAENQLQTRLANLALPPPRDPDGLDLAQWQDATFAPRDGVCRVQRSLTGVSIRPGPVLALDEDGATLTVPLELESAAVVPAPTSPDVGKVPVAAVAWQPDENTLRVQVRFVDTPHTLTLILSKREGTFRALWPTIPMHALPLRQFRTPDGAVKD